MSEFKDHFSAHADSYAKARPTYPRELFSWLAEQCERRELAWDCATGNGQAAIALAEFFDAVHATDASAAQIGNAFAHERVRYAVAPAEASRLPEASCDLVTVATALHWFDHARFNAEVQRVLKPGGVIAAWAYGLTRVAPEIDAITATFDEAIVGPWWPPERRHVDTRYAGIPFPFTRIAAPEFEMRVEWDRRQFLAYHSTWSSVQRYRKARGHDPLVWLEAELASFWPAAEVRSVRWPLFMMAGRR